MTSTIFSFLICIAATTVGAISGIGGGVIIKPVLDAVSGLPSSTISFLSGCTVLAMAAVSLLRSRSGSVKVEPYRGTLLAVGAAGGGVVGKLLFDRVSNAFSGDGVVGVSQSVIMVLLTLGVLLYVRNKQKIRTLQVRNPVICVLVGLLLGLLSSFLGIGGGPINLAVLYYFFSMDTKTAALNSIYIILFSQIASLVSTFARSAVPTFAVSMLVGMVLGGVAGGFLGRSFSGKMSNERVDRLFQGLLLVITLISCYNVLHYAQMLSACQKTLFWTS